MKQKHKLKGGRFKEFIIELSIILPLREQLMVLRFWSITMTGYAETLQDLGMGLTWSILDLQVILVSRIIVHSHWAVRRVLMAFANIWLWSDLESAKIDSLSTRCFGKLHQRWYKAVASLLCRFEVALLELLMYLQRRNKKTPKWTSFTWYY